jgi:hypothetical protein
MLPDRVRVAALALAFIMIAPTWGCGDDEVPSDDGDDDSDAGMDAGADAGEDAGEDLCPGLLTFEAIVAQAQTGTPEVAVNVTEVGGSAATSSAPNGRAQLCLPADAESLQVQSTKTDFLPRLDTLAAGAIDIANAAAQPYPLDVLSVAAADDLLEALAVSGDPNAALLLVSVVSYPDALPLSGATVNIDKDSAGSFASDASGAFLPAETAEIGDGRALLYANVALDGEGEAGQAAITVTPPADFAGTCVGPPTVALEPGGVSGALFACQ